MEEVRISHEKRVSGVAAKGLYPHNAKLVIGRTADGRNTPYISLNNYDSSDINATSLRIHLSTDSMIDLCDAIKRYVEDNCYGS